MGGNLLRGGIFDIMILISGLGLSLLRDGTGGTVGFDGMGGLLSGRHSRKSLVKSFD